jgi:hypothetical protein
MNFTNLHFKEPEQGSLPYETIVENVLRDNDLEAVYKNKRLTIFEALSVALFSTPAKHNKVKSTILVKLQELIN